jgi:hypothetical protein
MSSEREATLARALIHRHGIRAAAVAREHAAQCDAQNDCEAASHWRATARMVDQLRAEQRAA